MLIGQGEMYRFVADRFPDLALPASEFIDHVEQNLRNCRLQHLVVGDGIREGLERVLEAWRRRLVCHPG